MKPVISVEGLGKKYTIRHEGQGRYRALREELFKLPQRLLQCRHQDKEEFWALKDVSFDIMPGDRVGIIGRNGAGKSTLLKLLSRITEPTTGRITLRGRVASLLEVGTGFHPELTGRENIFLNGAILGMSRAEVRKKFDEIVDFAGVEKFLDTPVKRYSSGMYVRLAFAVAAHLEPEILIVDEVLAVGDAEFQKKCLGKMEQVGQNGRTVLFVSHNEEAIFLLCNYGIQLHNGLLQKTGSIPDVIENYKKSIRNNFNDVKLLTHTGTKDVILSNLKIFAERNGKQTQIETGSDVHLILYYDCKINIPIDAIIDIGICNNRNKTLFWISTSSYKENIKKINHFILPKFPLIPGEYTIKICLHRHYEIIDRIEDYNFVVQQGYYYESGYIPAFQNSYLCHNFIFKSSN